MLLGLVRNQCCTARRLVTSASARWYSEQSGDEAKERAYVDDKVKSDKVVVFMKGDRQAPRCGFSGMVVRVLEIEQADYTTYDVLSDSLLRSAAKTYANWPTFPQVYISGEFVGGCDIIVDMHKSNELQPLLKAAGALRSN